MLGFREAVRLEFANAAKGERSIFPARGRDAARFVVRQLLYAAQYDIFVFSGSLPNDIHRPSVYRNVSTRPSAPRVRILLDADFDGNRDDTSVYDIDDLIAPRGPIQLRMSAVTSPVHMIVVDQKHLLLDRPSEKDTVLDLNAPEAAKNVLQQLDQLWNYAVPIVNTARTAANSAA
jgi:hypothetical protein